MCSSSGILFESMESMEEIFNVNMIHVGNVSPDLSFLKKSVIDRTIVSTLSNINECVMFGG